MSFNEVIKDLSTLYESVELDTPYMLRNDGKLISCKELLIHPYINTIPTSAKDKKVAYEFLLTNGEQDNYEWFLKYSKDDKTKELLNDLLTNKNIELLDELRYRTNQEFCRVRTSGKFLGNINSHEIYFRISSFGFNWFDLIWQVVQQNKYIISNVTVCTDSKAKGYDECYKYRGIELLHLPVDEFLELPGTPIIEKQNDENKAKLIISEELELGV